MTYSYKRVRQKDGYWTYTYSDGKFIGKSKWHGKNILASEKTVIRSTEKQKPKESEKFYRTLVESGEKPPFYGERSYDGSQGGKRFQMLAEINAHVGSKHFSYLLSFDSSKAYLEDGDLLYLSEYIMDTDNLDGSDIAIDSITILRCYDKLTGHKILGNDLRSYEY